MTAILSSFQIMEGASDEVLTDSDKDGATFDYRRFVTKTGVAITCSPGFKTIKSILDNLERLEIRSDDVILASYPKAGTSQRRSGELLISKKEIQIKYCLDEVGSPFYAGTHWLYEILSMLLRHSVTLCDDTKGSHFLERISSVDDVNKYTGFRLINTHIHPRHLPEKLIKHVGRAIALPSLKLCLQIILTRCK